MDRIGGMNVNFFSKEQILAVVADDRSRIRNKKVLELIAGVLITRVLASSTHIEYLVGFPLKNVQKLPSSEDNHSLEHLLQHPELVDDSDIDVCIGNEQSMIPCQVVRVPRIDSALDVKGRLQRVINKKLKVPKDDNLNLIIMVEDEISLNEKELKTLISSRDCPYGSVWLVFKVADSEWEFQCARLHPNPGMSTPFRLL
jgi:hypothetical protein